MKKLTLLLLVILTISCAKTKSKIEQVTRLDNSIISVEELDKKIQKLVDTANVTGITVSVFNQDTLAYQRAFGYSNFEQKDSLKVNEVFYGASLSKSVFGYLVANLVQEGVIDLDKPLQSYLETPIPELYFEKEWRGFKNLENDKRYEQITARMCLSHTTGFPNWRWITRKQEFFLEGKIHFYFDPGTEYSYSGEGIRLLQIVIEKVTGRNLEELAREVIFDPLHMDMTSYVWQKRFENNYCLGHNKDQQTIEKDTEETNQVLLVQWKQHQLITQNF